MDQERKEHILKSYNLGRRRYILVHGVLNWGISTALLYRSFISVATHGWSLGKVVKGILSVDTLYAMVLFGLVGVLFGHFMWKWIEKTAKGISDEPSKSPKSPKEVKEKGPKGQTGKKKKK